MIDHNQLLEALGFSDVVIEQVVFSSAPRMLKIYVKSLKDEAICHCCGQRITDAHGLGTELTLRHLPMFDYPTFIMLKPKRYRCMKCEGYPTTTQILDWYTPRSAFTKAYEQDILRALVNSTIEDVSCKYAISPDQITGLIDRRIATHVDWTRFMTLEILGIDEISLKKGHKQYVTIVSALVQGTLTILAVLPDRTKATVEAFFRSIPKRLRRTVAMVCSDLYAGFIGATKAVFGRRTAICADRFHIAKLYREGVESVRKNEMRRIKKLLSKEDYTLLKNAHWILRKSDTDLTSDERHLRTRLSGQSHQRISAYC